MMHDPALEEYLNNLEILGYDISDYVQLTHSFILLNQLILSAKSDLRTYSGTATNFASWLNSQNYLAILEKYNLSPIPLIDERSESIVQNLCTTINTFFLREGYQYYFEYFAPESTLGAGKAI